MGCGGGRGRVPRAVGSGPILACGDSRLIVAPAWGPPTAPKGGNKGSFLLDDRWFDEGGGTNAGTGNKAFSKNGPLVKRPVTNRSLALQSPLKKQGFGKN